MLPGVSEPLSQGHAAPHPVQTAPATARARPIPHNPTVSRVAWFFFFAIPSAVLITAAMLTPSPLGHGTHMQLGLPPCGFLVVTGYPCPGCGLTTCFTHMIRGEVVAASRCNAFGVMLFLMTLTTIPISFIGMIRGSSVIDALERFQVDKLAILLSACSITVWLIRIAILFAARH